MKSTRGGIERKDAAVRIRNPRFSARNQIKALKLCRAPKHTVPQGIIS